jgi:hypothetical protein
MTLAIVHSLFIAAAVLVLSACGGTETHPGTGCTGGCKTSPDQTSVVVRPGDVDAGARR